MRFKRHIVTGVAAVLGIGAGVAATAYWIPRSDARTAPSISSVTPLQPGGPGRGGEYDARLRALEARLGNIQTAPPAAPSARPDRTSDVSANTPDRATPEELNFIREAEHAEVLARFRSEPRDAAWAPRTEDSLRLDLEAQAAKGSSKLVAVRCQDTLCTAVVRWESYEAAAAQYGAFLAMHYRMNCATSARLPQPAPGREREPYDATIVLDFTETKTENDESPPP